MELFKYFLLSTGEEEEESKLSDYGFYCEKIRKKIIVIPLLKYNLTFAAIIY